MWRKGWPCRFGDLQQGIVLKPVDCSLGWENPPKKLYVVSSKMSSRKDQFINFPLTRRDREEKMNEFIDEYGIPQTVGAIDGCHIEINAPPQNKEDYYNRKQHDSVILQAIVDCSLKFLHVSVGYPGSIHDARVLRLSGLFDLGNNQQILESPSRVINGTGSKFLH